MVHEFKVGFNQVLVGFIDDMEIKECSSRVMVVP